MGFSLDEALGKIGTAGYTGIDGLKRLVSETSAIVANAAPDATLLLYSGKVGDAYAWDVAARASNSSIDANGLKQVVTIADTPVYKLLNDAVFKNALKDAVGGVDQTYNLLMDGKDATGARISNTSLWDTASKNLASSATGDILTFTPNAPIDGVFMQTEVDAALNSRAPTINGIPREDLVRLKNDLLASGSTDIAAKGILFDRINTASAEQTRALTLAADARGNLSSVGTKDYLALCEIEWVIEFHFSA